MIDFQKDSQREEKGAHFRVQVIDDTIIFAEACELFIKNLHISHLSLSYVGSWN